MLGLMLLQAFWSVLVYFLVCSSTRGEYFSIFIWIFVYMQIFFFTCKFIIIYFFIFKALWQLLLLGKLYKGVSKYWEGMKLYNIVESDQAKLMGDIFGKNGCARGYNFG